MKPPGRLVFLFRGAHASRVPPSASRRGLFGRRRRDDGASTRDACAPRKFSEPACGGKILGHAFFVRCVLLLLGAGLALTVARAGDLQADFHDPPAAAKPWAYWYWMHAAVSRAGITADLEAMKQAGLGGAYLMPIQGPTNPPLMTPPVNQLSPEFWGMVRFAMQEADRLGLKLAFHASDGFSLAGGPWITPELSMQKVVWTDTDIAGGRHFSGVLPQPETIAGYYRDIEVLAFPSPSGEGVTTRTVAPRVTTSLPGVNAQFLAAPGNKTKFASKKPCWIEYAFAAPFTCRSLTIIPGGDNYQANRLLIEVSDDGEHFRPLTRLVPPRHGWQDGDANVTHSLPAVTARFFRFVYDPAGSEPGGEDLDWAKWPPALKLQGIELSSAPRIDGYEGKNGEVWRVSPRTTAAEAPAASCVPLDRIVNLTKNLGADGRLDWDAPPGRWTILRLGCTSTGHENETGGAGRGLECDKFNPAAAKVQFDHWFGEAIRQAGPDLAAKVLKIFHSDSWEAGSQNWSPVFRTEFEKRRGYDPLPWLPAMAGIPVQSADLSERFLHDVRQTIAELIVDDFFVPMTQLAHAHGCVYSSESVAPTMVSDGMAHFGVVDIPMGEFWLRSPTHDKPNDILDAISGGHIYGRPIIQAEAFTELSMAWDEYPGMLKALGDWNYSLGINRFVHHVFVHNPWPERRPGMTLNGVGLFFDRNQTWWGPGRAWISYEQRCQALLQAGRPVADVAVFTGEQIPRRAVLPEWLTSSLPGVMGAAAVAREARLLANVGEPQAQEPKGVWHSAHITDVENWPDPLRGYTYDSINRDALLRLAKVRDGRIVLPGGASYALLVLPEPRPLDPDGDLMSPEVAARLLGLVKAGATLLVAGRPDRSPNLQNYPACDATVRRSAAELWAGAAAAVPDAAGVVSWRVGHGRVVAEPFRADSFADLGVSRDFEAADANGARAQGIAWAHRASAGFDLYFISNQENAWRAFDVSLRVSGRVPELWNPVTGEMRPAAAWRAANGRTTLPLRLPPSGSVFVVLRRPAAGEGSDAGKNWFEPNVVQTLASPWQVAFDPKSGGPTAPVDFAHLESWTAQTEPGIRTYSGTADYTQTFTWTAPAGKPPRVWLELGRVADIAAVTLNGVPCGVAWTAPWRVEITRALRPGENRLEIAVTNTWANRLIGDHALPADQRLTWTTAPYRLAGTPLLPAGLFGPVELMTDAAAGKP